MIDMHVHSTFSDGSLTPEELVAAAGREGLTAVALTDHDTTGGIGRFVEAGRGTRVVCIPGVEMSAEFSPGTMHVLGYFVRPGSAQLEDALESIRDGRDARNKKILAKLQKMGMKLTWEQVKAKAGEDVVGRPHFAQAMLEGGYVDSTKDAFDRYLAKGQCAYVDRLRLAPGDCIEAIRSAGGAAVLAHPSTIGMGMKDLAALVGDLAAAGLAGIEAYYSEHTGEQAGQYAALAAGAGLAVTGGSDFHGAVNPDIRLGRGFGSLRVPDDLLPALCSRAGIPWPPSR